MRKSSLFVAVLVLLAAVLTGCTSASRQPIITEPVSSQPSTGSPAQGNLPGSLPGDAATLKTAVGQAQGIRYEIVTVDSAVADRTAYLDSYTERQKWPEKDMLVLMVFTKDNQDLRFAMGAHFFAKKVTVDEMLSLVRTLYQPKAKTGDVNGGLTDLVAAINSRMK